MARKKNSNASAQPNPLGWMVTFSDLVTLLLTFFVLLISMSSMDVKAIQQSFGLFSGASGLLEFTKSGKLPDLANIIDQIVEVPADVLIDQQALKDQIFHFDDAELQKMMSLVDQDIEVVTDERGLVIRIGDYILFTEGGAELRPQSLFILSRLADVLGSATQQISVEGHTDASPLEGGYKPWAWELSLERAIAVLEYFTKDRGLLPDRFRVGGFGPSQPLAPNDTAVNRARNRRIEIVLYKETIL
jgi:chemotaxis protein MotB